MNSPQADFTFGSADGRFGLILPAAQVSAMRSFAVLAGRTETGGVLVGRYNDAHSCAHVTKISGPPRGSKASATTFERAAGGLARWLGRLWRAKNRSYYLGEWHFHPFASPVASSGDFIQMRDIARSHDYRCPEPLLLIFGGDPRGDWDIRVYVFPQGKTCIPLHRQGDAIFDGNKLG